jgi:ribonuclease Z
MTSRAAARLVFLGTGAAANVARCQTAIAVQFAPDDVLLLDTAGGFEVARQLERAGISLPAIRYVFLSHRHSDHLGGLEPLLLRIGMYPGAHRADQFGPVGLTIYGEARVLDAGRALIRLMTSVAPEIITQRVGRLEWVPLAAGEARALGPGARLWRFPVEHPPYDGSASGCVVELERSGHTWRLVYSGDTRPAPELGRQARGANVLLHEVGGLDQDAAATHGFGHSTAGEAARLAAAAGAGRLFLYHVGDDASVAAYLAEAQRYFSGPLVIPNDLDAFDLVLG